MCGGARSLRVHGFVTGCFRSAASFERVRAGYGGDDAGTIEIEARWVVYVERKSVGKRCVKKGVERESFEKRRKRERARVRVLFDREKSVGKDCE